MQKLESAKFILEITQMQLLSKRTYILYFIIFGGENVA